MSALLPALPSAPGICHAGWLPCAPAIPLHLYSSWHVVLGVVLCPPLHRLITVLVVVVSGCSRRHPQARSGPAVVWCCCAQLCPGAATPSGRAAWGLEDNARHVLGRRCGQGLCVAAVGRFLEGVTALKDHPRGIFSYILLCADHVLQQTSQACTCTPARRTHACHGVDHISQQAVDL